MNAPSPVVLLVEDDNDLRGVMGEALSLQGIRFAVASNGSEAIGYLRNAPPPAIILLDLMMPVMDGIAFRQEQLANPSWSEIPVILLSADREIAEKAKALGAAGFIRKPADLFDLVERVGKYIR